MGFHQLQSNFTGGILSPYLFLRSDFKKYPNGAEDLFNTVVKVSGGAVRRAGTQFVAKAKSRSAFQKSAFQNNAFQMDPTGAKILLVPFIFNTQEAYVLEFGAGYIRFFRNRKQLLGTGGGSELVLNGNFDTDLTSWTLQQDNGATVTWDTGHAVLTPGAAGTAGISQTIAGLDPGTTYVVNFTAGGVQTFQIGTALGAGDVIQDTAITSGDFRATFVAPSSGTIVIYWRSTEPFSANTLDNVSALSALPLELATTYTAAQLRSLRFAQSADVLYICHPEQPVRKLTRLSDILWTLQDVVLSPPPSEEVDLEPATTLTPGATIGQGVNFHAGAVGTFFAADINRQIHAQGGLAVITAVVDSDDVTADIIQPFISTNPIGAGLWSLDGSPSSTLTLGAAGPVNTVTSATLTIAGFRSIDVGAFILGLEGIAEITAIGSDTVATVRILKPFTGTSLVSGAWTLERESFSTDLGFPDVPCFFEQRFWLFKGQDVHGSVSGDFENFAGGSDDDDAVRFPIAGRVDVIRWAKAMKNFVIGAIGSEYKVDGGDSTAITPTNVHAAPQSDWGSDPEPDAIPAGVSTLFVQRGRQNVREMAFDYASDGFTSPDLCILADHLFGSGIIQLARCASPDSFVLAVMEDGSMNCATYERKEDVVAWTRLRPGTTAMGEGAYLSACVIPAKCGTGDEIWAAVERNINGRVDNYIEVFDGQLNTDCSLVSDDGDETLMTSVTGFGHLAGESVDVLTSGQSFFQKGAFQGNAFQKRRTTYQTTVIDGSGELTIPDPGAVRVEAGLHYENEIKTLRPDPSGQGGTAMFQKKRSATVYIRFLCSGGAGIKVNGELVKQTSIESQEVFDYMRQANLGWDRDGQVTIRQTQPFAMTVLGVAYSWQASDGDIP